MKTILFVGQAPAKPASKHEIPGTYLHAWLHSIGMSDEDIATHCHFYALTDTFPGNTSHGHLPPTREQMDAYRPELQSTIRSLKPGIVVPVGKMAIEEMFDQQPIKLTDVIGSKCMIDPFASLGRKITCVPLSHPSGRSVWNAAHKPLVNEALQLLRSEMVNSK